MYLFCSNDDVVDDDVDPNDDEDEDDELVDVLDIRILSPSIG